MVRDVSQKFSTKDECDRMTPDRRRRRRFTANWHVRLLAQGRATVDACTVNVSSGGFYCRSPEPFSAGDNLTALLDLPSVLTDRHAGVVLRCDVRVLRLESFVDDGWGIACQIDDYSILRATNTNDIGAGVSEGKRGTGSPS